MKLSEVKRKKELVPSGSIPLFICPTNYVIELMWYVGTFIVVSHRFQSAVFNPMRSQSMHDEELPTGNQLTSDSGEAKSAFTFSWK